MRRPERIIPIQIKRLTPIRQEKRTEVQSRLILETAASDWEWLDAIAGKFSDDFFAAGREQPDLPPRPELDGVFEWGAK